MVTPFESFNTTFKLKDIFPTFQDFEDYLSNSDYVWETPTSDYITFFAKPLYLKFYESNINYDTIHGFKRHFCTTWNDNYQSYKARRKMITETYQLSVQDAILMQSIMEDIQRDTKGNLQTTSTNDIEDKIISAIAMNNNSEVPNPLDDMATYLTQQNGSKNKANTTHSGNSDTTNNENVVTNRTINDNKARAIAEVIKNISNFNLEKELGKYKKHFMSVFNICGYYFGGIL